MAAGPSITGIEGWRVALLLLGFIVVTVLFEGLIDHVEKRLRKRKGLLTAFRALKNELLYLGFLSLILSVTQDYLARICIPQTSGSSYYTYKLKYGLADHCAEDKEPLWPVSVQHETHFFIFTVAVTHIAYCAITIALTLHKVAKWRKWEDEALAEAKSSSGDVKVMQETVSRSLIRSMCTSALATMHHSATTATTTSPASAASGTAPSAARSSRSSASLSPLRLVAHAKALATSLAAQFRVSVSHPMYHNVRLMFIEKMGLTYDFDYHTLVTNGMESQLAKVVHASWPLWLIATLFLVLPCPSYVPFWSYVAVIGLMLVVGAKLVSITALLGMQVAIKYGDSVLFGRMDTDPLALKRATLARRRRMSLSQLADSLGDTPDVMLLGPGGGADGADGGGADGGEPGGGGADGGGAEGGAAAVTGAHVLDEALPADAGCEVQAQVAAVTALTSREEALNMLRTLAAMPLLPPEPGPPRTSFEPPLGNRLLPATSRDPPTGNNTGTGMAAAPQLLPSPSLLLGIAPPRWGPPPPAQFRDGYLQPQEARPPGMIPESPTAPTTTAAAAAALDAQPSGQTTGGSEQVPGDVAITVRSSEEQAPPGTAAASVVMAPGSRPVSAVTGPAAGVLGGSQSGTAAQPGGQGATSVARRPSSGLRPSTGERPPSVPTALVPSASGFGDVSGGTTGPQAPGVRPGTAARGAAAAGSALDATGPRPLSAVRPSLMRPGLLAVAAATGWAHTTKHHPRRNTGLMLCGVATARVTTALEHMEEAIALATSGDLLSPTIAPLVTSQSGVIPGADGAAAAAAAAAMAGTIRPTSPAVVPSGLRTLMASMRLSRMARASEEIRRGPLDSPLPRTTVDGIIATAGGGPASPLLRTTITSPMGSPLPRGFTAAGAGTGGVVGGGSGAATFSGGEAGLDPGVAELHAAAAAAALMRHAAWSPRRPLRRCMSARTLIRTRRIGDNDDGDHDGADHRPDDLTRTFVRRVAGAGGAAAACGVGAGACVHAGNVNNATIAVGALAAGEGGPQRPSGAQGYGGSSDIMLPAAHFGQPSRPTQSHPQLPSSPMPAATAAAAPSGLKASIHHFHMPKFGPGGLPVGFFGPRKKANKAHQESKHGAEVPEGVAGQESPTLPPPAPAPPAAAAAYAAGMDRPVSPVAPASPPEDPTPGELQEAVEPSVAAGAVTTAPPPGPAFASVFALHQVPQQQHQQQQPGGGGSAAPSPGWWDLASVYDSLAALLPPPPPADAYPHGAAATGPADGSETETAVAAAVSYAERDASTAVVATAGAGADARVSVDRQAPEAAFGLKAGLSSQVTGSSSALGHPHSELRIVRLGDTDDWLTAEEAVALASLPGASASATVTAASTGPLGGADTYNDAALAKAAAEAEAALTGQPSGTDPSTAEAVGAAATARGSPEAYSSRVLNATMSSAFLEAPSFEAPSPMLLDAELPPQQSCSSVFSTHSATRSDSFPPADRTTGSSQPSSDPNVGDGGGGGGGNADGEGEGAVQGAATSNASGGLLPATGGPDAAQMETSVDGGPGAVAAPCRPAALQVVTARAEAVLPEGVGTPRSRPASPSAPGASSTENAQQSYMTGCRDDGDGVSDGAATWDQDPSATTAAARFGVEEELATPLTHLYGNPDADDTMPTVRGVDRASPLESSFIGFGSAAMGLHRGGALETSFIGFGNTQAVDLSRTARRIGGGGAGGSLTDLHRMALGLAGGRDLSSSSPDRAPSSSGSSLSTTTRMRAVGSTASLASLAPWGAEASGPPSRQDSASVVAHSREASMAGSSASPNTGGGSRSGSRSGAGAAAVEGQEGPMPPVMPPPPPAPPPPPPAPPPPAHLRLQVVHEHGGETMNARVSSAATVAGRWAVSVEGPSKGAPPDGGFSSGNCNPAAECQPCALSTAGSTIPEDEECCVVEQFDGNATDRSRRAAATSLISVTSCTDDLYGMPVCEGSAGVGREDVLVPACSTSSSRPRSGGGGGAAAATDTIATTISANTTTGTTTIATAVASQGTVTATPAVAGPTNTSPIPAAGADMVTSAGLAAGATWVGLAEKRRRKTEEQQHIQHYLLRRGHHHHRSDSGHPHHNSDSDSDGGGTCWPPCIPRPWASPAPGGSSRGHHHHHHHQGATSSSGNTGENAGGGGSRVVPLPGAVQDQQADNLGTKAKFALTSYTEGVKERWFRGKDPQAEGGKGGGDGSGGGGGGATQRKLTDHWLERVRGMLAAHRGFENMDAAQFFWFHNPRVIAYLFNWAYYENSLSIALLVFSFVLGYQNEWVFTGAPSWAVGLLLAADLFILVHSCLYVLPLYALITPVGAHCPKDVLRRALKAGVYTRQTALIAKAMHLQLKAREAAAKEKSPSSFFHRITAHWGTTAHWGAAANNGNNGHGHNGHGHGTYNINSKGTPALPPSAALAAASAFARAANANMNMNTNNAAVAPLSPGRATSPHGWSGGGAAFSPNTTGGSLSPNAVMAFSPNTTANFSPNSTSAPALSPAGGGGRGGAAAGGSKGSSFERRRGGLVSVSGARTGGGSAAVGTTGGDIDDGLLEGAKASPHVAWAVDTGGATAADTGAGVRPEAAVVSCASAAAVPVAAGRVVGRGGGSATSATAGTGTAGLDRPVPTPLMIPQSDHGAISQLRSATAPSSATTSTTTSLSTSTAAPNANITGPSGSTNGSSAKSGDGTITAADTPEASFTITRKAPPGDAIAPAVPAGRAHPARAPCNDQSTTLPPGSAAPSISSGGGASVAATVPSGWGVSGTAPGAARPPNPPAAASPVPAAHKPAGPAAIPAPSQAEGPAGATPQSAGHLTHLMKPPRGNHPPGAPAAKAVAPNTVGKATTTTTTTKAHPNPQPHVSGSDAVAVTSTGGTCGSPSSADRKEDEVVPFATTGSSSDSPIRRGQQERQQQQQQPGDYPEETARAPAPAAAAASMTTLSAAEESSMELSFQRGAPLGRQGSGESLSSSLGRSGNITALVAGMFRGAVAHLSPEEQRAAAATGRALLPRGGRGGLDMTLVPEG